MHRHCSGILRLTMTLPFDKITIFNFPYYVKVFFPELFNIFYGDNYKIRYFPIDHHYSHNLTPQYSHRRTSCIKENDNRYMLLLKCIKPVYKQEGVIYGTHAYKLTIKYMIENRHLEEYWIQSNLLKEL